MNQTPTNCKEEKCSCFGLPPVENSWECVGCKGNKDSKWVPKGKEKQNGN